MVGRDPPDVGECILLFGAAHRGSMGERAQTASMEHLLASVAPPDQCFWHALTWDENRAVQGQSTGKSYDGDNSHSIPFTADYFDELNKFKALVVGDSGILNAKLRHTPPEVNILLERLTLPTVMMSAPSSKAKPRNDVLLHKAVFEPGRDAASKRVLSSMLRRGEALVWPGGIVPVRDPVLSDPALSDETLTDTEGTCWKQSEGEHQQPLCFILPASSTQANVEMHRQLLGHVVRRGDVFINVFQEHQRAIEEHDYPGEILQILERTEFMGRLCSCRAIVSTRLDGALLGLHMGVPTFGAFASKVRSDEVRELMVDTMHLPEHCLAIDERLTRQAVDLQVETMRRAYADQNRRALIHARLSAFSEDFRRQARHVLSDIVGVQEQQENRNRDAKPKTQKALAMATGISIRAAKASVPRAVERLGILSMLPSADEAEDESTTLRAVPENSPIVDTAAKPGLPSLAAVSRSNTNASKRALYAVAKPTVREEIEVSESQVLISHHRGRVDPPSAGAGTIISDTLSGKSEESAGHDLVREAGLPVSTSGAASGLGVITATGESVPMSMPTIRRSAVAEIKGGTSSVKLFKDDYIAVMLFISAIVGLALLPPRGLPRRPCHGKLVAAKTDFVGQDSIDMELGSCTSSDSELSVVSEWTLPSPVRSTTATNSAEATSSVIFLVLNFMIWVFLAVGFSGYCMAYLSHTHDPVGLLTLQGATGVAILLLLGLFAGLDFNPGLGLTPAASCQVGSVTARKIRLAALMHAGQMLLANAAVLVGGVDATNALSAATEPVAATVFSYLLLGKTCSGLRLAALTTIVAGTLVLVFERKNDHGGGDGGGSSSSSCSNSLAVLAMTAVCVRALRNVAIKGSPDPPPHQTLLACSVAATVVGVGLMLVRIMCRRMDLLQRTGPDSALRIIDSGGGDGISSNHDLSASWLQMDGVNAALCIVGCNLASFNLLARLSLIDHAVGSSCKRMLVFAGGLFVLGRTMTVWQLGGTVVTFFGVLTYNIAGIG